MKTQEHHISRKDFKDIIEKSINYAVDLDEYMKDRLQEVANKKPYVAFGSWYLSNSVACGCPAWEAGLAGKTEEYTWKVVPFTHEFDNLVKRHISADIYNYGILLIDD